MSSTARVGPVRSEESPGSLIFTSKKRGGVPTWLRCRSYLAPLARSRAATSVWPRSVAFLRAVPSCGHAQAEEQHRGGHTRPSARALKIGTRHQARCRSRKSQVPCRLGPVSGDFGGAHVFLALKRPFPPSRPSTRPQLGATALKFHKICTTRSATRAPWRWRQPWATFSCWVCL